MYLDSCLRNELLFQVWLYVFCLLCFWAIYKKWWEKIWSSEIQVDGAVDCLKIIQVRNDKYDGIFLILNNNEYTHKNAAEIKDQFVFNIRSRSAAKKKNKPCSKSKNFYKTKNEWKTELKKAWR